MIAKIEKATAKGVIKAPPSKSYAHRLLIGAALSENSIVHNVSFSNDINATINCLEALGYAFTKDGDTVKTSKSNQNGEMFDCQESGSTLRFLIPIVLAKRNHAVFKGTEKLFSRGLSVYEEIFKMQNLSYIVGKDNIEINGKFKPGHFKVRGDISSQFITGLLFACPLLDGDSEIEIVGNLESAPYVDITLDVLKIFDISIDRKENRFYIKGHQTYIQREVEVEGDYSNAAFLDALNLLGGEVRVTGLKEDSKQGDKVYRDYFQKLESSHPTLDISNCIDLGPILFTVAALKHGAVFTGINRLRIKESDRVKDMMDILTKFGVEYSLENNKIEIFDGVSLGNLDVIHCENDHRLVMSTAILLTTLGGRLDNIEAVKKSYPYFFDDLKSLGIGVAYETF